MTLLVALVNERYALSISDRRLTRAGHLEDDEYNKVAVLILDDARVAVSFTGLAEVAGLSNGLSGTHKWLLEAMGQASGPDGLLLPTLERLETLATQKIDSLALPRTEDGRLSLLVVGFAYRDVPKPLICLLSNFEDLTGDSRSSPSRFQQSWWAPDLAVGDSAHAGFAFGIANGLAASDLDELHGLLKSPQPPGPALAKAFAAMRRASRDPKSGKLVGTQLMGVVIPCDPTAPISSTYDLARESEHDAPKVSAVDYGPSSVDGRTGSGGLTIGNPEFSNLDAAGVPTATRVEQVGRNRPCPCHSGRKYKLCHGLSAEPRHGSDASERTA